MRGESASDTAAAATDDPGAGPLKSEPIQTAVDSAAANESPTAPMAEVDPTAPPGDPAIEADSLLDEGFVETSNASLLSTVPSEVTRLREEHGRQYPNYGKNPYGMPVDDDELDRLDLNHYKYTMAQGDNLYLAPVSDPQMILDLGTGTGIWAIEVADKLPSATIIGTDIAPVQPEWVPPNCTFQIDDAEDDWTFPQSHFDYIHNRDFLQSIRNWPRLIEQCFLALKPGGWIEFASIHPVPQCDDGTMTDESAFLEMTQAFQNISQAITREPNAPTKWKRWFAEAGFTEITQRIFLIPSSPWAKDPKLKKIGAFELMNVLQGAQGFLVKGYIEELGKTREELELLLYRMRKELISGKVHSYVPYYVVYARKP